MNLKKNMAENRFKWSRWDRSTGQTNSHRIEHGGDMIIPCCKSPGSSCWGTRKLVMYRKETSISKLDHFDICMYIYIYINDPYPHDYTLHAITSSPSLFWRAFSLPPGSMLLKRNLKFGDKRHIQPIPAVAISCIICLFVGPSEVPTLETGSET